MKYFSILFRGISLVAALAVFSAVVAFSSAAANTHSFYSCSQATGYEPGGTPRLVYNHQVAQLEVQGMSLVATIFRLDNFEENRTFRMNPDDLEHWIPRQPFNAIYVTPLGTKVQVTQSLLDGDSEGWFAFGVRALPAFYCVLR